MHTYCKAYTLGELRRFKQWKEQLSADATPLADDTIVYLWDDLTVVKSPILNEPPLFQADSTEWKEFCQHTLHFAVPAELVNE